jgi:hypothetical protein
MLDRSGHVRMIGGGCTPERDPPAGVQGPLIPRASGLPGIFSLTRAWVRGSVESCRPSVGRVNLENRTVAGTTRPNLQGSPGPRRRPEVSQGSKLSDGEFDPGSGRTLAACLKHASRAGVGRGATRGFSSSGERVSNTWATYPGDGDNPGKPGLIPDALPWGHPWGRKRLGASPSAPGWARGLSARWWGNGPPRR